MLVVWNGIKKEKNYIQMEKIFKFEFGIKWATI